MENVGHFHSSSKYSPQYTRGSEIYLTMTARVVWRVILIPLSTESCFIDIVNMFFNMFLKHVLKTRKMFKNQSPIKLLFKTFLKHHLDILKTFLECQIVSWAITKSM